jgi:hypothetical protein
MLSALLYLIISSALKTKEVIAEENNAKLESSSLIETFTDDGYLKTYRYPDLTFNKNNKNIPIAINPNLSECKSDVLNYDEINLNSLKQSALESPLDIQLEIESENDVIPYKKPKTLKKVTTYMDLPGYKSYNLLDLNKYELKNNNNGLISYVELDKDETFKAHNSLIIRKDK